MIKDNNQHASVDRILAIGSLTNFAHGQVRAFQASLDTFVNHTYEVKVIETSFRGAGSILRFFAYFFSVAKALLLTKYDIVYFLPSRSRIGALRDLFLLICLKPIGSKTTVIAHLHGSDFKTFFAELKPVTRRLYKWAYRRVDKFIVLTDRMKDQFEDTLGCDQKQIHTLNNFFEPTNYDHSLEEKYDHTPIRFFYLSSVAQTKGIFEAILIVKALISMGVEAKLEVAGSILGDEESSAANTEQQFTQFVNTYPWLTYHGVIDGETKYNLLASSVFFILPTRYRSEALPLSIIEAMSCRCCILSTDRGYISDIIEDQKNGFLLEQPKNIEYSAQIIKDMLSDMPQLKKVGLAAEHYVETNFTLQAYHDNLFKIIKGTEVE